MLPKIHYLEVHDLLAKQKEVRLAPRTAPIGLHKVLQGTGHADRVLCSYS